MSNEQSTFTVTVTESSELTLLVSSLSYMEKRQLFLANMANNKGRERESLARRESAATTVRLSEKLYAIGAKEGV